MAFVEVGAGTQRASKTTASHTANLAFPGNVTSGNLLLVIGEIFRNDAPPVLSVTGSRATYTIKSYATGDANDVSFIAFGVATSSGAETVTVEMGGVDAADTQWFAIDEFSGEDPTTPLSVDGGTATGTSTTPNGTINTVTAGELVVGVMTPASPDTVITPGTGWTQIGEQESHTIEAGSAIFQIVGAAGPYSVNWTLNPSRQWWLQMASFKLPAGSVVFRKTLSGIGSRVGTRQVHGN